MAKRIMTENGPLWIPAPGIPMVKCLFVGDPHVVVEELEDCHSLVELVLSTAIANKVTHVVWLGDLHHNHAVVRVEVMEFWLETFAKLKNAGFENVALVGNHDRPGDSSSTAHALKAYKHLATIVDSVPYVLGNFVMLPYVSDTDDFVKRAQENKYRHLVCHQTFTGSKYENGMYAHDGIDPESIPQVKILSGHIHTPQAFGKVWYLGAPRWRTVSDANVVRHIAVWDGQTPPLLVPTHTHCRPLECVTLTETEQPGGKWERVFPNAKVVLDVYGSQSYIEHVQSLNKDVRIRTFLTQREAPKVSESKGIRKSLEDFVLQYPSKYGTAPARLLDIVKERIKYV